MYEKILGKESLQRARRKGRGSLFGLGTHSDRKEYSLNCFRIAPAVLEEFMNSLGHHPQTKNTLMRKLSASIWFPCLVYGYHVIGAQDSNWLAPFFTAKK